MLKRIGVDIEGMSCAHCQAHVQNLLEEVHGVIDVKKNNIGHAVILVNNEFNKETLINHFNKNSSYKVTKVD